MAAILRSTKRSLSRRLGENRYPNPDKIKRFYFPVPLPAVGFTVATLGVVVGFQGRPLRCFSSENPWLWVVLALMLLGRNAKLIAGEHAFVVQRQARDQAKGENSLPSRPDLRCVILGNARAVAEY